MTQTYKKKLIEVAMPLEAINTASAREKSIRHGHPSTLHLYWARRPLAACRAVIFAQLVDDPSAHPDKFPTEADQQKERERLFKIIEELVIWENSTNEEVLKRARDEILKSCDGELPPIHDPFSGGGSIPLEAQRLGLPAYGSDLNPVAVMIGKAMIEIPPLFRDMKPIHPGGPDKLTYNNAQGLAEDVQYYGERIRQKAFERIGHYYPKLNLPKAQGGGEATIIAWIWARTVPSPDPALNGLAVPLVRTFELSTARGNEVWVEPIIEGSNYSFEVRSAKNGDAKNIIRGTVNRQGATCLVSGSAMPFKYLREQAKAGNFGVKLMCIVAESTSGKTYISADQTNEDIANSIENHKHIDVEISHWPGRTNVVEYGMTEFGDLFSKRQLIALNTFAELIPEIREEVLNDINCMANNQLDDATRHRYASAVVTYLSFAISKLADYNSTITSWGNSRQTLRNTFGRQAIPMTWDFAEVNVFSSYTGNWMNGVNWNVKAINQFVFTSPGFVNQNDAQTVAISPGSVISTDPPYYDNIGYADLSDFFFIWLKKALKDIYPELFGGLVTPKSEELVATPYRHGGKKNAEAFFLEGMSKAIKNMADSANPAIPATIYYAFKQSEIQQDGISSTGWATFLEAVIKAGYTIAGTWPIRTEMANRMIASGTNALANSVVLVCRQRGQTSGVLTRAEFIRLLKKDLPKAVAELKAANISPADIPQASIGPGISIFSQYHAVLEADDSPMSVKTALQLINRELGAEEGDYDSETSFALTWFEQFGFNVSDYGTANNIANAKGIAVESLLHAGIAQSAGGKFSLLSRDSLEAGWDPDRDKTVTIWECCQYLCRRLENRGEFEAAKLMRRMGPERADAAKELAYALYDIAANKLNDATEATSYNSLISAWSELTVQAANMTDQDVSGDAQGRLL